MLRFAQHDARPVQPRRRGLRRVVLLLCLTLPLLLLASLGGLATCRPAWYVPTSVDRSRLRDDKREFVALLDGIGAALNRGDSIELTVTEEQINRWLAARSEWADVIPPELEVLQHPQVQLLDDQRLRAAATIERGGRWIVSLAGRVVLTQGELEFHWESLRVGTLPVPRGWLPAAVRDAAAGDKRVVRLLERGVARVPASGVWRNGERPFRVERLSISQGVLRITLAPGR